MYNLDYNSLKHEIKVHTTRDQASAMAIPGHQDTSLRKFEDGLFDELCNQHDRVDLFVTSKADEISRRLEHLNTSIQRCIAKHSTGQDQSFSLKRQRRFAKYERELMRCGDDIQALSRFANAQIVAFRKILKKYRVRINGLEPPCFHGADCFKKWTGSTTLTSRFNDIVLGNSKSFTRRDFSALQTRYDALLSELRSAAPVLSDPGSPSSDEQPLPEPPSPGTARVSFDPFPPTQMGPQVKYWNEYDDGSDAGGPEDDYAIYINPSEDTSFPGMAYVQAIVSMPSVKAKQWFRPRHRGEWRPLLSSANTSQSYSSTAVDSEEEGYASSDGLPYQGYMTHYALPSVSEQRAMRYRERALLWGTVGSFIASFVLLGIAGILTSTGKRKLRVEVDAGVTVGIMLHACSMGCFSCLCWEIYAPDLFALLGITGSEERLLVTAVFGIIKLIAALVCALFLVDVIGRKRALLTGITLQSISMIYVASFLTAVPQMGVVKGFVLPNDKKGASRGAIAMIYISGFGWAFVTIVGGIWVWFSVPETSGRSLESMDRLFELPWYKIGLYGNRDAEQKDIAYDEKQLVAEEERGTQQRV
ncbi:hypothetical protein O9K51_10920 [Purpureocillium lavendulum]|uniref:SPX domain-containing protein n=1 Tax=Purpureocillium lavendulum TaxID=1247861 RepID=A0AB34FBJ7_9HYPO|nr:hypothetical protein O9K51_10920 [Purpureocillium lavendulum]